MKNIQKTEKDLLSKLKNFSNQLTGKVHKFLDHPFKFRAPWNHDKKKRNRKRLEDEDEDFDVDIDE